VRTVARLIRQPVVLVKWYKMVSWIVDRVDHFPKDNLSHRRRPARSSRPSLALATSPGGPSRGSPARRRPYARRRRAAAPPTAASRRRAQGKNCHRELAGEWTEVLVANKHHSAGGVIVARSSQAEKSCSVDSPAAKAMVWMTASRSLPLNRMPFASRNRAAAKKPLRLLPSING